MGSREIDLEEAEPHEEDRGASLGGIRGKPPSNPVAAFKGVSVHDAGRLSDFVQDDFAAVCHIVTALCGTDIDVEGAVAEATARAVEQLGAGRSIEALSAWITRVAVNLARSENRRRAVRRRKPSVASQPDHTDAGIESIAVRMDMQQALRELTKRQAEVVALYYGLDLPVSEVALTLGRSEGTVKATLFTARSALARALSSKAGDDDDSA